MRTIGTTVRGIRAPIIKEGDDIINIVVDSLQKSWENEGYELRDHDVVGITESAIARAQGNYVTVDEVAQEVCDKFGEDAHIGVVFPILSRNRFSIILKGIARAANKITLLLSYPRDEVGNMLFEKEPKMERLAPRGNDSAYMNKSSSGGSEIPATEAIYRIMFAGAKTVHPFTGVDYVQFYKDIIETEGAEAKIIFGNHPGTIVYYTNHVLISNIHERVYARQQINLQFKVQSKFQFKPIIYDLADLFGKFNQYGLLGSNMAGDERLKLFPRNGHAYVEKIQKKLKKLTGKHVEVMIYGDGAFKDPQGKIWELADPVVSPAYTAGLAGTPNEIKMKLFADTKMGDLTGEAAEAKMREYITEKDQNLVGNMHSEGTTPRQLTDLLGSLCDLTSGSGDKGTPIVLIQGYFDNYATE